MTAKKTHQHQALQAFDEARATARQAYIEARRAYDEAWRAYTQALQAYDEARRRLGLLLPLTDEIPRTDSVSN